MNSSTIDISKSQLLILFVFTFHTQVQLLNAQSNFGPQQVISVADAFDIKHVIPANINGDNRLDVVFASQGNALIGWHQQKFQRNFSSQKIISSDANSVSLLGAADVDNSGIQDVIAYLENTNSFVLFSNEGAGVFGEPQTIAENVPDAKKIILADLNNDDHIDLLTNSKSNGSVVWFQNQGDGTFNSKKVISNTITDPYNLIVADFNKDSHIDVVYSTLNTQTAEIGLFTNNGDGTFGEVDILESFEGNAAYSLQTADLDSDADLDILAGLAAGGTIWIQNLGQSFGTVQNVQGPIASLTIARAVNVDNQNGIDIVTHGILNTFTFYRNNGSGTFEFTDVSSSAISRDPTSLTVTDLNSDGTPDFLGSSTDNLFWIPSVAEATFTNQPIIFNDLGVLNANQPISNDFNGDNTLDILVATGNESQLSLFLNLGEGSFANEQRIQINSENLVDFLSSDIDNDSDYDIISAHRDSIRWSENQGNGQFSQPEGLFDISDRTTLNSIKAAKLDQNELPDLVSISSLFIEQNNAGNRVSLYQDGFSSEVIIDEFETGTVGTFSDLLLEDIDADGYVDIVASLGQNPQNSEVVWYKNIDGSATFEQRQTLFDDVSIPTTILEADINSDTFPDVITIDAMTNELIWHQNSADGFGTANVIDQIRVGSVFADDVNLDEAIDLIVTTDNGLIWYQNLGGSFSQGQVIDEEEKASADVIAHDLNDDGSVEIILTNFLSNKVAWYENTIQTTATDTEISELPNTFRLEQNFPNPFNPSTTIQYSLPKASNVQIDVFDMMGRNVATLIDQRQNAGTHSVNFNAEQLSSGVYFYRLQAENFTQIQKMVLIK